MKLSVIIPCLNAAKTIGLQLEALESQGVSWPWEVIVADNGSKDDTSKVVKSYLPRFPNLRIVDASQKRGASFAMNRGASAARAQFLAFCDADDEVAPGWMQAMVNALSTHDIAASRFDFQKLNPPSTAKYFTKHPQTRGLQKLWYPPHLKHVGACGLGVKKSLHEALGGFDESLLQVMDADYCVRAQLRGIDLHFASDALVHIRLRETPLGSYKQLRVWGEYNVLIYKRYRPSGAYEWWRWRHHLYGWKQTLRSIPQLMSQQGRDQWFRRVGWQTGILKGSIKYMVPPIPLP